MEGPRKTTLLPPPGQMAEATKAKYGKDPLWQGVLARFPRALRELSRVSAFGTRKHEVPLSDMSYLSVPDGYNVYSDAVGRHLVGEAMEGPVNLDPGDGGQLHAAQLAWNALARLEVYLKSREPQSFEVGHHSEIELGRSNAHVDDQCQTRPERKGCFT